MPDTRLDKILTLGTDAERLAFVPDPPTDVLVCFFTTDTAALYAWDGAWQLVVPAGTATLPIDLATDVTGTLPAGSLVAHAPTHASAGTDPVTVTALGGFPGGTSGFLRADATFATPTGAPLSTQQKTRAITVVFGTGSAVITAGQRTYVSCPYTGTITRARLLAVDAAVTSGSIVIDVWRDSYAAYPPTVADTITASAKPTLSSAIKSDDATLTGWTTAVTEGDVFGFSVDSAALVTQVALQLTVVVT